VKAIDAAEISYKNGYIQGYKDGVKDALEKLITDREENNTHDEARSDDHR
jgi:hypothetical protein